MKYDVVLWDFDGTLVDTSEGIFQSLRRAFAAMGRSVPQQDILQKFIGPPLMYSFANFIEMSKEDAEKAVWIFREHYEKEGVYCSKIYEGLPRLIEDLRARGVRTGVATLKPEPLAKLLLKHFGVEHLFDACSGNSIDEAGSATKADMIAGALDQLEYHDKSKVLLIGDTVYDADGAQESGIDFLAVSYGFGLTREELQTKRFVGLAHNAAEIEKFLFFDEL